MSEDAFIPAVAVCLVGLPGKGFLLVPRRAHVAISACKFCKVPPRLFIRLYDEEPSIFQINCTNSACSIRPFSHSGSSAHALKTWDAIIGEQENAVAE